MLLKKQDNRRGNINPRFMRGLFNGKWACNTTWRDGKPNGAFTCPVKQNKYFLP